MKEKITRIKEQILEGLKPVKDLGQLNEIKIKALGKKSEFSQLLKEMVNLKAEERKQIGKFVNETKNILQEKIDEKFSEIKKQY